MSAIVRLSFVQTTVPLLHRSLQRVSESDELRDLEFELANLLVGKLRYLPARRSACISHTQDIYQFF